MQDRFSTPVMAGGALPTQVTLSLAMGAVMAQTLVAYNASSVILDVYIDRTPNGTPDLIIGAYERSSQPITASKVTLVPAGNVVANGQILVYITDNPLPPNQSQIPFYVTTKRYFGQGFNFTWAFANTAGQSLNAGLVPVVAQLNAPGNGGGFTLLNGDDVFFDELTLESTQSIDVSIGVKMASEATAIYFTHLLLQPNQIITLHPGLVKSSNPLTPGSQVFTVGDELQASVVMDATPATAGKLYVNITGHVNQ